MAPRRHRDGLHRRVHSDTDVCVPRLVDGLRGLPASPRIKEDYDLSGDNSHAVAAGLDHTGRLVTAAAGLLAIVFITFMTSAVSVVKLVGLGLTLAVLIDAFVIRATLVPAIMKLAGRTNWWAPRRLRRLHLRFGIWEREPSIEMDRLNRAPDS